MAAIADTGVETTDVPSSRRLYIGDREAKESQYEAFAAAIGRTERAIAATADAGRDIAARAALPESGEWGATVAAVLGPLGCGRDLANVSTVDLARRDVPPDDLSTALGVGSLLERVASLLNLRTKARVARVDNAGRFSTITLDGGAVVRARSVILAVPAAVIAAGTIRFNPALPGRFTNALLAYPAGQMEHVGFLLPNNPLGLSPDELVHVKAGSYPPAALYGRVNDTDLHVAVFGGAQASEIASKGEAAAAALTQRLPARGVRRDDRRQCDEVRRLALVDRSADPRRHGGGRARRRRAAPAVRRSGGADDPRRRICQPGQMGHAAPAPGPPARSPPRRRSRWWAGRFRGRSASASFEARWREHLRMRSLIRTTSS